MRKKRNSLILIFSTLLLVVFFSMILIDINILQDNARVINYVGIIRGGTQKLIKNEIYGVKNGDQVTKLDNILLELQTGKGSYDLTVLNERDYGEKLVVLAKEWQTLKALTYAAREDTSLIADLYYMSEAYYTIADDTVSAAEEFSRKTGTHLSIMQLLSAICIATIMTTLLLQTISEIKQNRMLNSIAYSDQSTKLPNKLSCEKQINNDELLNDGKVVCCFMFDLNNLKLTNDTLGHKAGDILIASFAAALRHTAPKNMFVGRLGGDEFIGIMENATLKAVEAFETKLLYEVSRLNERIEKPLNISFAYGYAFSSDHYNCTIKSLMDTADKKMYERKAYMKQKQANKQFHSHEL